MHEPNNPNDVSPSPDNSAEQESSTSVPVPTPAETQVPIEGPEGRTPDVDAASEAAAQPEPAELTGTPTLPWRKRIRPLHLGIAVGAVVVLGIAGGIVFTALKPTALENAADACSGNQPLERLLRDISKDDTSSDSADSEMTAEDILGTSDKPEKTAPAFEGVVSVEDDGGTLIINTKPQDEDLLGLGSLVMDCVYDELNIPVHISERIG